MGFLKFLPKSKASTLLQLPSGSFTVDRTGAVLTQTLPSNFPREIVTDLAHKVLSAFREATQAQLPLSQLIVDYPSLRITARELRGGAMIFLSPKAPYAQTAHT
jgi:hypothetical protein